MVPWYAGALPCEVKQCTQGRAGGALVHQPRVVWTKPPTEQTAAGSASSASRACGTWTTWSPPPSWAAYYRWGRTGGEREWAVEETRRLGTRQLAGWSATATTEICIMLKVGRAGGGALVGGRGPMARALREVAGWECQGAARASRWAERQGLACSVILADVGQRQLLHLCLLSSYPDLTPSTVPHPSPPLLSAGVRRLSRRAAKPQGT